MMRTVQYRAQRFQAQQAVHFYRIDELVSAEAQDVSAHGLFVRTDAWLPINGVVDLAVTLPDGTHVVLSSRVAHCLSQDQAHEVGRYGGIGFEVLPSPRRDHDVWRRYVRSLGAHSQPLDARRRRLLLVSQKPRLLERLVNALQDVALELSFYDARHAAGPELACQDCWDALIVDMPLSDHAHVTALREAAAAPMMVLAPDATAAVDAWRSGAAGVLVAPFDDVELREGVARLDSDVGPPDMSGDLSAIETTSVLSMLEYERREGVLTVHGRAGAVRIRVGAGTVRGVQGPNGMSASAALSHALGYREGRFEFRSDRPPAPGTVEREKAVPPHDARPISQVLFEHAKASDEAKRDAGN